MLSGISSQNPALAGLQTTGASASFTQAPIQSWTQRLDSPIGQRFLQAISDKTGISQQDLVNQLQGGSTLHDILASKGVTFAQVRQAVRSESGQGQVQGASHHHHGQHGGGAGQVDTAILGAIAGKLGMQPPDLAQQLNAGTSLAQLASDKGVSASDLGAAVEQALQSLLGYTSGGTQAPATQPPATAVNQAA